MTGIVGVSHAQLTAQGGFCFRHRGVGLYLGIYSGGNNKA